MKDSFLEFQKFIKKNKNNDRILTLKVVGYNDRIEVLKRSSGVFKCFINIERDNNFSIKDIIDYINTFKKELIVTKKCNEKNNYYLIMVINALFIRITTNYTDEQKWLNDYSKNLVK